MLVATLISLGAIFMLLGSVGLIRFPDVYTRIHGMGLSGTMGISSLVLGSMIYFNFVKGEFSVKELLILLFLFFTSPVATHMVTQAAYRTNVPLWRSTEKNRAANKKEVSDSGKE